MNLGIAFIAVGSCYALLAEAMPSFSEMPERITVSSLLVVGIVYLYKRNERDRREHRSHLKEQAERFVSVIESRNSEMATLSQNVSELTVAVSMQTETNRAQVEIYKRHIDKLVDHAGK